VRACVRVLSACAVRWKSWKKNPVLPGMKSVTGISDQMGFTALRIEPTRLCGEIKYCINSIEMYFDLNVNMFSQGPNIFKRSVCDAFLHTNIYRHTVCVFVVGFALDSNLLT